ncbi:MAG TPA: hypothetical protein PKE06_24135 [Flavilitoribacter sp.]|nr:hypothetical protein [Flavilitoribacter sp.]
MNLEIIEKPFHLVLYGFSGTAQNEDYAGAAFKLMDKMWQIVKANHLNNKGRNIWVYEPDKKVFAGVELEKPYEGTDLEKKAITLDQYAWYKHIGPYNLIKKAGLAMQEELEKTGIEVRLPYIEIYGHWTNDETKLETELLMAVK